VVPSVKCVATPRFDRTFVEVIGLVEQRARKKARGNSAPFLACRQRLALRSIPSRFLPRSLADDSAFTSIRGRSDVRAIFSVPPGSIRRSRLGFPSRRATSGLLARRHPRFHTRRARQTLGSHPNDV